MGQPLIREGQPIRACSLNLIVKNRGALNLYLTALASAASILFCSCLTRPLRVLSYFSGLSLLFLYNSMGDVERRHDGGDVVVIGAATVADLAHLLVE